MDKTTPIGLVAGFALIFGTILSGSGFSTFFDVASIVMVLGGTISALLVSSSMADLKIAVLGFKGMFGFEMPELAGYVSQFSDLSKVARREGLLALDKKLSEVDDDFMRFGLEMAVDGMDEEIIDDLIKARISTDMSDAQLLVRTLNNAGTYCPAFGMVGTLIGLIQMMQNLTDPAAIGAGMAVAMVTTFYGALLSNLVFLPAANKARNQMNATINARMVVRTGVMGVVRGDSPSMIEKRLMLFLKEIEEGKPAEPTPLRKAA